MMFIVWQVVLPITMIFIGGYAYSTLVNPDDINKTAHLSYPAFLTAGLIGYNVVWTCVISGNIILNDRINGMFDQFLGMPFTRLQYILSNLLAIILLGLAGGAVIIIIGLPTLIGYAHISIEGIFYILFAIVTCSLIFGSAVVSISLKFENVRALSFQVESGLINGLLQFLSFASSAFYPTEIVPSPVREIFLINPLTHVVDIIRDSLFFQLDTSTNFSVLFLGAATFITVLIAFLLANRVEVR